jgi:hypothetical protein
MQNKKITTRSDLKVIIYPYRQVNNICLLRFKHSVTNWKTDTFSDLSCPYLRSRAWMVFGDRENPVDSNELYCLVRWGQTQPCII